MNVQLPRIPELDLHLSQTPQSFVEAGQHGEAFPVLYHYTTFSGLLGIASTRKMWATNIHFMNDYAEFVEAVRIAQQLIQAQRTFVNRERNEPALNVLQEKLSDLETSNIFVASFTENGDALSQWRGYSGGSGVSIGFRYSSLQELAKIQHFRIVKCIYDASSKRSILGRLISWTLENWGDYLTYNRNPENDQAFRDRFLSMLAVGFQSNLFYIAPAFKDDAFSQEGEWRLVSQVIPGNSPSINFRPAESIFIPYFEFELCHTVQNLSRLPIGQIILGPRQGYEQQTLALRAVKSFVFRNDLDSCSIMCSEIPYRTSL